MNNRCDPQGLSDRSSAYSLATASTVLVGVGLAAVAGGAALYFTAPHERSSTGMALSPLTCPGGLGLSLRTRW